MKSCERSGRYMASGPVVCPDEVIERGSKVCAVGEDISQYADALLSWSVC